MISFFKSPQSICTLIIYPFLLFFKLFFYIGSIFVVFRILGLYLRTLVKTGSQGYNLIFAFLQNKNAYEKCVMFLAENLKQGNGQRPVHLKNKCETSNNADNAL